jgi:transposase
LKRKIKQEDEPIRYSILVRNSKDPALIRERMVRRYYETRNYSQVAREFGTKRQRVKFWVERFEKEGVDGLRDKSRAPHNIPHKTSKDVEEKIKTDSNFKEILNWAG